MNESKTLSPKLCIDCTNVLERVEELECASPPVIDWSTIDPRKRCQTTKQLQQSSHHGEHPPEDRSLEHKSTRTALLESANSGCDLCRWLLDSLNSRSHLSYSFSQIRSQRRPAFVQKDPCMSPLGIRCAGHYHVSVRCRLDERTSPVRTGDNAAQSVYQKCRGDEKASLIADSLRSISEEYPGFIDAIASPDDGSPNSSTWTLFEHWLAMCTSGHSECKPLTTQHSKKVIPTRLLDIQDPDIVRLVDSDSCCNATDLPRYCTLSYCWSVLENAQLNKGLMEMLVNGVDRSSLPHTFRDAIIVAQRLNIPFLWIRSLCILQDSTQDWLKETSKLGSIFRNSYLCIAASASKDSHSGFLERRDLTHKRPLRYRDLIIQQDVTMPNDNFSMRQITWCDRMRTLADWGVERAPLNQHVWAIQERMFAPRILHCTSDEFIWECCTGMRSESHPLLTNGSSVVKDAWKQLSHTPQTHELTLKHQKALLERWSELIATYSKGKVSKMDDKLDACSAIAREFQPMLGTYTAGLWKDYLPSQLLWSRPRYYGNDRQGKHSMLPRSKPSWSWASLDCRVELPYYYDGARDREFNTQTSRSFEDPINLSIPALIKILDVNVKLRGNDPTGAVDDASIHLGCCQLYPIYRSAAFGWRLETEPPGVFDQGEPVRWAWDDPDDFASAPEQEVLKAAHRPDNPDEAKVLSHGSPQRYLLIHKKKLAHHAPTLTQRCCLPVAVMSTSGRATGCEHGTTAGLVLEYTSEARGQYRRVGCFWCGTDYLLAVPRYRSAPDSTLGFDWPSVEEGSLEEGSLDDGYTISVV